MLRPRAPRRPPRQPRRRPPLRRPHRRPGWSGVMSGADTAGSGVMSGANIAESDVTSGAKAATTSRQSNSAALRATGQGFEGSPTGGPSCVVPPRGMARVSKFSPHRVKRHAGRCAARIVPDVVTARSGRPAAYKYRTAPLIPPQFAWPVARATPDTSARKKQAPGRRKAMPALEWPQSAYLLERSAQSRGRRYP